MPGKSGAPLESTRFAVSPDEAFIHGDLPLDRLFPQPAPLEVEFGTGKGRFLIESGRLHPERCFLGIERSLAYYRIARDRIAKAQLDRVRVIRADAAEVVELLPNDSVHAFHAYFLDPWPKRKQRKRRLLGERFLAAAAAKAKAGSPFRIITDHEAYGEAIEEAVDRATALGTPWRITDWSSLPAPPPTHYELKYRKAGRTFRRFLLIRK